MNNIKKFGFLGLLLLASCSSRMNGVSGRYDHFDADAYWVSGGFENESDARPLEQRRSSSLSSEPSDRALRPLEERYEGYEDRVQLDDDRGIGFSVADYRRAYRQGYRDGSLDGSFYPGLYRPNYGGWGWGIGPGIGWNAPCWSWGGRWNYFSFWNNPWNNPWGPSWGWGGGWNGWGGGWNHFGWGGGWNGWGYGGWNGWGGGWNHIGWGGWNGWGGSPYVWVHRGPQTWAGPRRDRLNRVHTTTPRSNRWTPWGQTASSHRSVRPTTYADRGGVQSTNIGETRGFRERPSLGSDRNTVPAVNETRRPALSENRYGVRVESPSRTRYEYRAPTSVNREPRTTYSTPRSTYSAPRSTYSEPKSTYSAPRSTNSAPRSTYSAPRSTYSAPRSTNSAPRSTNSAPRSTYTAPRSSSSGSSGSSSGSSGTSRSAPSSSGRSGSFSPRR
ncbi:MAG: hypothetical protein ACO31H_05290 [Bacteroidia bacterium]